MSASQVDRHLVVIPQQGLGNRLRAIACARRLCWKYGARCTVVWPQDNYAVLFEIDEDVEVVPRVPLGAADYRIVKTLDRRWGGHISNRRVPMTTDSHILVQGCQLFCADDELIGSPESAVMREVAPWLPMPSPVVRQAVATFRSGIPTRTVGLDIRQLAMLRSHDAILVAEADRLVSEGRIIFLATDNPETEHRIRARYGDAAISYPKPWFKRGAGGPSNTRIMNDDVIDFIDMQLLASCDYIIGSSLPSFTKTAMAYNGSPLNLCVRRDAEHG